MKKVILGIMIFVLAGVLVAQSSFATSLLNVGNNNNTTYLGGNNSSNGNSSNLSNNNSSNNATYLGGNNSSNDNNSNTSGNSGIGNSYTYNNSVNDTLPQTGLDNTLLFVITAVALVSVVIAFKKVSDYGNI